MSTFKMKLLLVSITIALVASDEQCGHRKSSSPLVYGGTAVNAGDYPWLVPLLRKFNDKFFCGSNLISRQHVLSAAHCIIEKGSTQALTTEDFYAYVGHFNLTVEEKHSHKADIKRIIVHPDWSTNDVRYDADISIIMLKRPVQYTDYIQPVCLPGPEESVFNVHGLVVGYGKSELTTIHENTPRKVEISSPTNEACFISDYQFAKFASSRTFCAGERGKTPCQGDSGSGFFIDVRSSHRILGIVSSTTVQECGSNDFVLFTSVPKYADWIQSEINSSDNEELEYVFDEIAENANVLESPKDKKKVTTECNYQDVSSTYTCLIKDLKLPDEEVQLRIQGGQHIPQRTNRDITAVQMVSGNVVHFPDLTDVLKTFPNLNGFAIAYSKLKYIDRPKFNGLRQFWFLLISDNEIETIPPDAFVDFNNMEVIDICRNKLTNLDPNWISTMQKLRVFRARSNKFQYVPADMFQYNPQLEEILFDYNEIQRIDADFSQLKKLTNLRFFGNTCIDMSFCDADSPKCIKSLRQFLLVVSGLCGHFTE